jgi:acyl-coenzyme A thioesterase PaaI-like protein
MSRTQEMTERAAENEALRRLENYPPFRAMNIRVLELDERWYSVRILLPLNAQNRNPGGSMFGGSVASLADPIPAIACHRHFPRYAVWTRELNVDFRHPGLSDLEMRFELSQPVIDDIARELAQRGRSTPRFEFGFYDRNNRLVAWVKNRVAIRPGSTDKEEGGAVPDRPPQNGVS